jgi:hypothetical protein
MIIRDIVKNRHIREVLHFTTNKGFIGIIDSKMVKARSFLQEDQRLEFILELNTPFVLDHGWENYVNCSISRINCILFDRSKMKWHQNARWRVLSFDPDILTHDGVYFSTTNNAYPSAIRNSGGKGLENLFAPIVYERYRKEIHREKGLPDSCPTCIQAEVLYPNELSTEYMKCIYVDSEEEKDEVYAQIFTLNHREVPIEVKAGVFQGDI